MTRLGIVAVGRNEGDRLRLCLASLAGEARVLYVDSGSRDGSPALARAMGVAVLELDPARPFSAARARHEGFLRLDAESPLDLVQFLDADCAVEPGWLDAAAAALEADASLGLVTGWRREARPRANLYHGLLETEWHGAPGPIEGCGGDMMVRASAYRASGGFDPRLISSEDEELVQRLAARTGLRAVRLPLPMTVHEAGIDRFGQWWRRMLRAGHGFAEVAARFPAHHRGDRRRAWAYAAAVPATALLGLLTGAWPLLLVLLAWPFNWIRTAGGLRRRGLGARDAAGQALLLTLGKLPTLLGMLRWHARRVGGGPARLIEYK